ncbi:MAG: DUF2007 domain-containing protein [Armatimonadetes bacterium]|nr:DUF2007 domain-containing protein [Anaerolineae bacterium]
MTPQSPQWLTVYTAQHISEAQIVAGRLQSEGIPAMVHYPVGGSAMGIYLGAVRVLVRPEHFDLAEAVLSPDEANALPDSTDIITYFWEEDDDADAE